MVAASDPAGAVRRFDGSATESFSRSALVLSRAPTEVVPPASQQGPLQAALTGLLESLVTERWSERSFSVSSARCEAAIPSGISGKDLG